MKISLSPSTVDWNAIFVPSPLIDGYASTAVLDVSWVKPLPSEFTMKISLSPSTIEKNAIFVPSPLIDGHASYAELDVSWVSVHVCARVR